MSYIVPPPMVASLPVFGGAQRFPVRRIFCIGLNYADHITEMGGKPAPDGAADPVFFCKPADAIVSDGIDVPYPQATAELHYEVEMVLALGAGGRDLSAEASHALIWGYGVGLDLTRRDLQAKAKAKGQPWDSAKAFDHSAPISPLRAASDAEPGLDTRLSLKVNGELRQATRLGAMILPPAQLLAKLSQLFELKAGDLIFTGTPAGVGPLQRGDHYQAALEGIAELEGRIL